MSEEEKEEKAPEPDEGQEDGELPMARGKVVVCWPQIDVFAKPVLISVNQINSELRILGNLSHEQCSILTSCAAKEMLFLQYHILLSRCNSYFCRGGSTLLLLCSHSKCVFHFLTVLKNSIKFLLIT